MPAPSSTRSTRAAAVIDQASSWTSEAPRSWIVVASTTKPSTSARLASRAASTRVASSAVAGTPRFVPTAGVVYVEVVDQPAGRLEVVVPDVEDHGRQVEQHAVQQRRQVVGGAQPQRARARLQLGQGLRVQHLGSRPADLDPHVPGTDAGRTYADGQAVEVRRACRAG